MHICHQVLPGSEVPLATALVGVGRLDMHTVAATAAWMQFTSRSFSFSSLTGTKEAAKEGKLTRMEAASTPHFSWCSLLAKK